jgi:uncharacterized protein
MVERQDISFGSAGQRCAAWLFLPDRGPAPIIVMAHGLGGVRSMRLDAYAKRFAAAGYACLVFDYRHFGDSQGQPRQLLDIQKQLEDWAAAIAFARTLDTVDGSRVVLWGTSFAGGHVLVAAARDQRVAAVISQCPFTDGLVSLLAMKPLVSVAVTARAFADKVGALLGREPLMVPTAGRPGSMALMSVPDWQGYLDLVPDGAPFRNEVAARVALDIVRHFPGKYSKRIPCPVLFAVCENDTVAPSGVTLRHARTAPRGEVRLYSEGHFEIYVGDGFEKVIADQLSFLRTHVPVIPTGSDTR